MLVVRHDYPTDRPAHQLRRGHRDFRQVDRRRTGESGHHAVEDVPDPDAPLRQPASPLRVADAHTDPVRLDPAQQPFHHRSAEFPVGTRIALDALEATDRRHDAPPATLSTAWPQQSRSTAAAALGHAATR